MKSPDNIGSSESKIDCNMKLSILDDSIWCRNMMSAYGKRHKIN